MGVDVDTIPKRYVIIQETQPSAQFTGQIWFKASTSATKIWNGSSWANLYASVDDDTLALIANVLQIKDGVQGDILYDNGSGFTKLNAGTNGQVLKTQGAAANPIWAEGRAVIPDVQTDAGPFVETSQSYVTKKTFTFTAPANCIVIGVAFKCAITYDHAGTGSDGDCRISSNAGISNPIVRPNGGPTTEACTVFGTEDGGNAYVASSGTMGINIQTKCGAAECTVTITDLKAVILYVEV